jgi:hypothetical protein
LEAWGKNGELGEHHWGNQSNKNLKKKSTCAGLAQENGFSPA